MDNTSAGAWRIDMLGGLRAVRAERVVTRFRTQKTGALLAYLAFHGERSHPRDLLLEILWPEERPDAARMWLRTALASLRRQLEPPGIPAGAVIVADRLSVGLNAGAVSTDLAQFEAALRTAARLPQGSQRARRLAEAVALYRGVLLPGYFEEWVVPEQQRLAGLFVQALRQLTGYLVQIGDLSGALDTASRAIAADPLREELHHELIRLYATVGQPAAAVRQFRELERRLREELGETPSESIRHLVRQIEAGNFAPSLPSAAPQPGAPPLAGSDQVLPHPRTGTASSLSEPSAVATGHLPPLITRFFGREAEIARIRELLSAEGVRLVTLTGPGGCGKTRLALEAAARLREALGDAVWFVPLADLSDPRRIGDAIHTALRLPHLPQVEPLEQVVASLSRRPSLLVLDNFEQLMPAGVTVVRDLLERAPLLQSLLTTRQILGLPPEREIAVGPLPVPVESGKWRVERPIRTDRSDRSDRSALHAPLTTLFEYESVALFVDRAQRVRPYFQLTRANAPAVADLCRRLEGIPLAIELAAARVNRLPPSRLLTGLERRFDLLISRQRDLPSRHQTLRAAIEWSYQLLAPEVQRFFAQLSVFRGGWTYETAQAVCVVAPGVHPGSAPSGRGCLQQLQECSLALIDEDEISSSVRRYRLLETVREFAGEQLPSEEQRDLSQRHAHFFLALAEEAELRSDTPERGVWWERLDREHDNLRAALAWSTAAEGDCEVGLRLVAALGDFWFSRGHWGEGSRWLETILHQSEDQGPAAARVRALRAAGEIISGHRSRAAGRALLEASVEAARRLGDKRLLSRSLTSLARLLPYEDPEGFAAARPLAEESEAICRELGDMPALVEVLLIRGNHRSLEEGVAIARDLKDDWLLVRALNDLGWALHLSDLGRARVLIEEGLLIRRRLGSQVGVALSLGHLSEVAVDMGDLPTARRCQEEGLAICREIGDRWGTAQFLHASGHVARAEGDLAAARSLYEESLAMFRILHDASWISFTSRQLGFVARAAGDLDSAERFHGEALAWCRASGGKSGIGLNVNDLSVVALYRGDLEVARERIEEGLALGREMDCTRVLSCSFNNLGLIALEEGDLEAARHLLEESVRIARRDSTTLRLALHQGFGPRSASLPAAEWIPSDEMLGPGRTPADDLSLAMRLETLGRIAKALRQPERVTRLLRVAEALRTAERG